MNNPSDSHASERTSGIDRLYIVGAPDSDKAEKLAAHIFQYSFEIQEFGDSETEKPTEYAAAISALLPKISDFVRAFGGRPLPLRTEHFHFYDEGNLPRDMVPFTGNDALLGGVYSSSDQCICILWQRAEGSVLGATHVAAHEAMHFNSFGAYRVIHKGIVQEREHLVLQNAGSGLTLYEDSFWPFWDLNEAVTEELAKKFDKFLWDIPELQDEIRLREEYKETMLARGEADLAEELVRLPKIEVISETSEMRTTGTRYRLYSYYAERMKLREIMQAILMRNRDSFSSLDDVFAVFAKAYFTGDTSELARIVDSAYGPGGFDRLGKETGRNATGSDLP